MRSTGQAFDQKITLGSTDSKLLWLWLCIGSKFKLFWWFFGGYGKWVKSKSKCAPTLGVFRGPFQAIWNQNWVICLKKTPWTLKNKEWAFFALKMLIFIHCIQTYLVLEAWNFEQSLSYDNQGHLPSLGRSPTNLRMVTHQKEVYYRPVIWHLHITHKTNTKWLPWMVTYHP